MIEIRPPKAQKAAKELRLHDHSRLDPYYWLREKDNQDVIAYLEAENAYCDAVMAETQGLQERLYEELHSRMEEDDCSVPVRQADYYYYHRSEKAKPYLIYCRKYQSLEAEEEILLDLNEEAKGHSYMELGVYRLSPDHKKLAYSLDTTGYESYTLYIKNLATAELYAEQIPASYYALEWANDSQTFFYNVINEACRPYKIFRHTLGTAAQDDLECFHEQDSLYEASVGKTKDDSYLYLRLASLESSEYHILNADEPEAAFRCVAPREKGLRYKLEHHQGKLYLLTNKDAAKHNQLMTTLVTEPAKENWQEYIPHQEARVLADFQIFSRHLAILEREEGLLHLCVIDLATQEQHRVQFPETLYHVSLEPDWGFETSALRLHYSSLVTPEAVYDYSPDTRTLELKKQRQVPGYDASQYEQKRLFATAEDGTRIPLSLVYKKDVLKDGKNPCLLYGYGAYGATLEPGFWHQHLCLLERGFVFAMAHVRGGGELGRSWYEAGKLLNKKNSFSDFIASARYLIAEGFTEPQRLAIEGRSAGGLLVASVLTMAPDLFKTALVGVPFVDVLTTMQDGSIPLTLGEYEEWGNPFDKNVYDYMLSYSPYDTIEAKDYPHILVTASLNDPRVAYWEPAKWTAKLRDHKTDQNVLLLKTNMGAGHGGASDRYEDLRETAFSYAFIMHTLGYGVD